MATLKERIGLYQFSTMISIADDDLFAVEKHKIIKQIYSSRNPFSLHPVVIVADPFLFVYKEELYLFYEEQVELTGKGIIKMTKTKNLKDWTYPVLVLEERFHLSYPNVFVVDGQIYMMPETGADNSIRLYTPNDDLTQWTFDKTLLDGRRFVDSDIVFFSGSYFLFTTDYTDETNILRMYYSDKLDTQWTEHPRSPIATGKNTGRCGGSIINYDGKLYRPCQLTQNRYGEGLDLYEISALSKENYKEERLKTVIPNMKNMYRQGGHHFNYCSYNNQTIIATDIFEIKLNYWEVAKRLVVKMKS